MVSANILNGFMCGREACATRQDKTRQDKTGQDKTRQGEAGGCDVKKENGTN